MKKCCIVAWFDIEEWKLAQTNKIKIKDKGEGLMLFVMNQICFLKSLYVQSV